MKLSFFLLGIFFWGEILAQDSLISGPGSTLTENKCKICHELQHIRRAQLSRGEWADNLRNMRERGTPMTDAEQQTILEYLAIYYNRESPAPAASADTLISSEPIQRLLDTKACSGCHALDKRVVGPSFREVAAKYSASAMDQLARKVREGARGAWGNTAMPPNPAVSEAEAKTLVGWILQQK